MNRPAVFLDRDGTINEQMGYINHVSRFVILPGVAEAIRSLNDNNYLVIVVSNQSGIARGYFPLELVEKVHNKMLSSLEKEGAIIDGIFFCPHYKKGELPEYSFDCDCRKPKTGLINQAREKFDIDMEHSYVIGDYHTDIELAHNAGLNGILLKTGYGLGEIEYILPNGRIQPEYIAEDLKEAVQFILDNKEE